MDKRKDVFNAEGPVYSRFKKACFTALHTLKPGKHMQTVALIFGYIKSKKSSQELMLNNVLSNEDILSI